MAIDWNYDLMKKDYKNVDTFKHGSGERIRNQLMKPLQLEECLKKFTEDEGLDSNECGCPR